MIVPSGHDQEGPPLEKALAIIPPGANAINNSGLLNPKKLENFKN
jgi:hypothetical protein